jgi:putative ABC transport system permease protein
MEAYAIAAVIRIATLVGAAVGALVLFFVLLFLADVAVNALSGFDPLSRAAKFAGLLCKNLRRNLVRTGLAFLAIYALVFLLTGIWSILAFLSLVTSEKSKDLKAVITERWQLPSQMPFAYAHSLTQGAPQKQGDLVVADQDSMTWQFYGGYIEKERDKQSRDNLVFFFATEPSKVLAIDKDGKISTMMDGTEEFSDTEKKQIAEAMKIIAQDKQAVVIGGDRLEALNKRVGETITVYSLNYRGIDLDLKIVGALPKGRYGQVGIMNRDYLNDSLDAYPSTHKGEKHPLAEKTLNLVWLRVPDSEAFRQVAGQIMSSSSYSSPAVKCETAASGISSWLDAYRDLVWGMRWLLSPTIAICMALVIANAISISVRERRSEMAVFKVLGYRPWQILLLVLGESLVIGSLSGLFSAGLALLIINNLWGGLQFGIAFFPAFAIAKEAWWWGLSLGAITSVVGTIWPAWTACSVRVSDVFAKVG